MAVSLKLPRVSEKQKVTFRLSGDTVTTLNRYVEAARVDAPHCDESLVLETILDNHFKRDKAFQKWLKTHGNTPPVPQ